MKEMIYNIIINQGKGVVELIEWVLTFLEAVFADLLKDWLKEQIRKYKQRKRKAKSRKPGKGRKHKAKR